MKLPSLVLVLAAAAALPAPALAFRQTCPDGTCVHWNDLSVAWKVNVSRATAAATAPNECGDAVVEAIVQEAFATWESAAATTCSSGLTLDYAGRTTSQNTSNTSTGEHIVVFRKGWCSQNTQARNDSCYPDGTCSSKYDCFDDGGELDRGTLAVTLVKYLGSCIVDADIEVADWSGTNSGATLTQQNPPWGWYWSCVDPASTAGLCGTYGATGCYFQDLENTLTHEVGHFLGLAHPCEFQGAGGAPGCPTQQANPTMWATTMFPTAPPGETQKVSVAQDDVDGLCAVYPSTFTPASCPSMDGASGCGCGGGTAGGVAALLGLAALAPRWRRRR